MAMFACECMSSSYGPQRVRAARRRPVKLIEYSHQLIDAMRARMPVAYGFQAAAPQAFREIAIVQHPVALSIHLHAVPRLEVVDARPEQILRIAPRSADQGYAAGERLEHADGRNAAERLGVSPARHVHRAFPAREYLRNAMIGQPAAVLHVRFAQRRARRLGIANSIDARAESESASRLDEELAQLGAALLVAPVAHPYQIAVASVGSQRAKAPHVRRLAPDPCGARPALPQIPLRASTAEGQHTVVAAQVECV